MKCDDCGVEYVGETARALGTGYKERTDGKHHSSAITEHQSNTGHHYSTKNLKVLQREQQLYPRKIREALEIHRRSPGLNRDKGQELPPIILRLASHDQPRSCDLHFPKKSSR